MAGPAPGHCCLRGDCIAGNAITCYIRPMPSITIRQLDEATKKRLRLRAARAGRSMEDEVRNILRSAAAAEEIAIRAPASPGEAPRPLMSAQAGIQEPGPRRGDEQTSQEYRPTSRANRVLLIIGGGV